MTLKERIFADRDFFRVKDKIRERDFTTKTQRAPREQKKLERG